MEDAGASSELPWAPEALVAFRRGEPGVLSRLFRAHSPSVARALRSARGHHGARIFESIADVEAAVLETFTRAFEERARLAFDGQRPFVAYLLGFARYVGLEHARRVRRLSVVPQDDELEFTDAAPSPDEHAEATQLGALLDDFRHTLDPDSRRLYELRFVDRVAQEAAAADLGVTRIQLRRRERDLKLALLKHLRRHGYVDGVSVQGWRVEREAAS